MSILRYQADRDEKRITVGEDWELDKIEYEKIQSQRTRVKPQCCLFTLTKR